MEGVEERKMTYEQGKPMSKRPHQANESVAEIELLQAEKRAAVRLLDNPSRIVFGWEEVQRKCGLFLDGKFVGETLEDVITAEAAKESTDGEK